MQSFMSRVKQFIHDHSEFSQSDIQSFIHSNHSRHSTKKVKKTNFDFLFQFLLFYFLKFKH